jgi:hypothetical protein
MRLFGWKKQIAVHVTWRDSRGTTKSIMRQIVIDADNAAVVLFPDGEELKIKISLVKKGTVFGQFLPGGKYGVKS